MMTVVVILFFLLMLIGIPLFAGMGLASYIYLNVRNFVPILIQNSFDSLNSYSLLAVPFFMFTGLLMNSGETTDRIVDMCDKLIGHIYGGLGHVNILVSMILAGVSGSAIADTAGVGAAMIPSMKKAGYSPAYSAVVTAVSSTIGPVIPPSIHMVVYASIAQCSTGKLFLAGVVPGVLMGVYQIIVNYFYCKKRNIGGHAPATFKEITHSIYRALPCLSIPFIIIGGILSGFCTATEAAIMSTAAALIIEIVIFHSVNLKRIFADIRSTAINSSVVFIMTGAAAALAWIMTIENVQNSMVNFFLSISHETWAIMLFINIILLILGMFISPMIIIMFTVPTFLPLVTSFGVDPIHFGIIVVLNVMIGFVTPPVGFTMMAACSIAECKVSDFMKDVWIYYIPLVLNLIFVIMCPDIVLFLPNLIS